MHPNLPLWGKLVALMAGLAVLVAGFAFVAIVGPLLGGGFGNLIRTAGHTYGAWASVAVLVVPLLFLGALVYYVLNRDARREYQQTRTITVEKKQKLHWAFKAMLWIYAAIIALMMVVIAATGFH